VQFLPGNTTDDFGGVAMAASPNGSMVFNWTWGAKALGDPMGTPVSKLSFFDGSHFDPATDAPAGLDLASLVVEDDGHALAIWKTSFGANSSAVYVSTRDPTKNAFGTATILDTTSYYDPDVRAWANADGSFTVVVLESFAVKRFTVGTDGSIGGRTNVAAITPLPDTGGDLTPAPLVGAERNGARLISWMSYENGAAIERGVTVDATGAWSDSFDIGSVQTTSPVQRTAALAANGDAIVRFITADANECETLSYRHFTRALGWGDVATPASTGCIWASTVGITDDGTVSTLYEIRSTGPGPAFTPTVQVFHAIAK
jgi:hypothetical protein